MSENATVTIENENNMMTLLYSFRYKGEHDKCALKAQKKKKLHERVCYSPGIEVSNDLRANTKEAHNRAVSVQIISTELNITQYQ